MVSKSSLKGVYGSLRSSQWVGEDCKKCKTLKDDHRCYLDTIWGDLTALYSTIRLDSHDYSRRSSVPAMHYNTTTTATPCSSLGCKAK